MNRWRICNQRQAEIDGKPAGFRKQVCHSDWNTTLECRLVVSSYDNVSPDFALKDFCSSFHLSSCRKILKIEVIFCGTSPTQFMLHFALLLFLCSGGHRGGSSRTVQSPQFVSLSSPLSCQSGQKVSTWRVRNINI